jgi:hypothetical protein
VFIRDQPFHDRRELHVYRCPSSSHPNTKTDPMADTLQQTRPSVVEGQLLRWRGKLYREPTNIEIEKVISRAFKYQDSRYIHPRASIRYGNLIIKGIRKHTYERVTELLQTLHPENLLNLEYVHRADTSGRNYLAVSNRHPLGHCLAKCLANSFAQQINQTFAKLDCIMTGNTSGKIAWAHGTESWYTPSDPTGGFDDCVYHPDNQVRVMSHSFMPPIIIYVVPRTELRHTREKCKSLVRDNLAVAFVVIISIDQVPRYYLEDDKPANKTLKPQTSLPSLPSSENDSIRQGDKISIWVLQMVGQDDRRRVTWPIRDVEVFPNPTPHKLNAKFGDLMIVPWPFGPKEPIFSLSFDELTAHFYWWRTMFAKLKEKWKKRKAMIGRQSNPVRTSRM